jgi:hypothetical protein
MHKGTRSTSLRVVQSAEPDSTFFMTGVYIEDQPHIFEDMPAEETLEQDDF